MADTAADGTRFLINNLGEIRFILLGISSRPLPANLVGTYTRVNIDLPLALSEATAFAFDMGDMLNIDTDHDGVRVGPRARRAIYGAWHRAELLRASLIIMGENPDSHIHFTTSEIAEKSSPHDNIQRPSVDPKEPIKISPHVPPRRGPSSTHLGPAKIDTTFEYLRYVSSCKSSAKMLHLLTTALLWRRGLDRAETHDECDESWDIRVR
ncbi:hypothetical protein VTJ49DRAFT_3413 [Mycothermus thermophilus]|uniref:Uncharacterized protein n=1 Tax=Humicola insolens TaxID=85995 RepID=A0ABR3V7L6_HUMIN